MIISVKTEGLTKAQIEQLGKSRDKVNSAKMVIDQATYEPGTLAFKGFAGKLDLPPHVRFQERSLVGCGYKGVLNFEVVGEGSENEGKRDFNKFLPQAQKTATNMPEGE